MSWIKKTALASAVVAGVAASFVTMLPTSHKTEAAIAVIDQRNIEEAQGLPVRHHGRGTHKPFRRRDGRRLQEQQHQRPFREEEPAQRGGEGDPPAH